MRRFIVILTLVCAVDLAAATRTWSGAAGNDWTIASNWKEGTAPAAGDDLVFPAGAANQQSSSNDFPDGTNFHSIAFTGGTYHLNGNPITIGAGGIRTTLTAGGTDFEIHSIRMPVTLGAPQTWVLVNGKSGAGLSSSFDLNGNALAIMDDGNVAPSIGGGIKGSGSISLTGPGAGFNLQGVSTSTAPFTVTNDTLFVRGTYLGPIILQEEGEFDEFPGATAGTVTATGLFATFAPGNDFPTNGAANSGNVSLAAGTEFDAAINTSSDFSTLNVTGTIALGGADLSIRTGNTIVPAGATATIINNDGSDAVTGTFRGLAEGGQIVTSFETPQIFRVSYAGGTGNDVTITAVGPGIFTDTALSSSASKATPGESVTLTAKVTADSGVPTGSIDFREFVPSVGYTILATVPLDASGTATFTTSPLTAGLHLLEADYSAFNPPFAPSTGLLDLVVGSDRRRAVKP